MLADIEAAPEQDSNYVISLQERESIRLLVCYGFSEIEENYKLYDHFLSELEDIEFQTPLYKEILDNYKALLAEGKIPEPEYFIRNGSTEIKQEIINLVSEKYELSQNWQDKFKIYVPKEKEIINSVVFTNVLRLKFRTVQKLIEENMAELKQTEDFDQQDKLLNVHIELKK